MARSLIKFRVKHLVGTCGFKFFFFFFFFFNFFLLMFQLVSQMVSGPWEKMKFVPLSKTNGLPH
jgi:hypothetical protein